MDLFILDSVFYLIFDELHLTTIHCQQVYACMQMTDG